MTVITFVIIAVRPGNTDDDAPMKDVFGSSVHFWFLWGLCVFLLLLLFFGVFFACLFVCLLVY